MLRVTVAITVIIRFSARGALLLVPQGRALTQDTGTYLRHGAYSGQCVYFFFEKQLPNVY